MKNDIDPQKIQVNADEWGRLIGLENEIRDLKNSFNSKIEHLEKIISLSQEHIVQLLKILHIVTAKHPDAKKTVNDELQKMKKRTTK